MSNYVISLGGSLIAPNEIDFKYLKQFRQVILKSIKKGNNFVIVCGGGRTARKYRDALKNIVKSTNENKDLIGICATRLNATLVKLMFKDKAYSEIIKDPEEGIGKVKQKIIVAGGWKPGWSTDYVAVKLAQKFRIKNIINLTDVDYVYDKDPNKFKNAKPLAQVSWKEFKKLIGGRWKPGLHTPFDPMASKLAEQLKYSVVIINGKRLNNLDVHLQSRKFIGTVII